MAEQKIVQKNRYLPGEDIPDLKLNTNGITVYQYIYPNIHPENKIMYNNAIRNINDGEYNRHYAFVLEYKNNPDNFKDIKNFLTLDNYTIILHDIPLNPDFKNDIKKYYQLLDVDKVYADIVFDITQMGDMFGIFQYLYYFYSKKTKEIIKYLDSFNCTHIQLIKMLARFIFDKYEVEEKYKKNIQGIILNFAKKYEPIHKNITKEVFYTDKYNHIHEEIKTSTMDVISFLPIICNNMVIITADANKYKINKDFYYRSIKTDKKIKDEFYKFLGDADMVIQNTYGRIIDEGIQTFAHYSFTNGNIFLFGEVHLSQVPYYINNKVSKYDLYSLNILYSYFKENYPDEYNTYMKNIHIIYEYLDKNKNITDESPLWDYKRVLEYIIPYYKKNVDIMKKIPIIYISECNEVSLLHGQYEVNCILNYIWHSMIKCSDNLRSVVKILNPKNYYEDFVKIEEKKGKTYGEIQHEFRNEIIDLYYHMFYNYKLYDVEDKIKNELKIKIDRFIEDIKDRITYVDSNKYGDFIYKYKSSIERKMENIVNILFKILNTLSRMKEKHVEIYNNIMKHFYDDIESCKKKPISVANHMFLYDFNLIITLYESIIDGKEIIFISTGDDHISNIEVRYMVDLYFIRHERTEYVKNKNETPYGTYFFLNFEDLKINIFDLMNNRKKDIIKLGGKLNINITQCLIVLIVILIILILYYLSSDILSYVRNKK